MRDGECLVQTTAAPPINASESGLWQTPVADDAVNREKGKWNSRGEPKLSAQVLNWPTPRANDAEKRGAIANNPRSELPAAAMHWPTPTATAHKGWSKNHNRAETDDRLDYTIEREAANCSQPGRLNPTWVEKLMGWPDEWTNLDPISHVKMFFWFMGFCDGEETRAAEVMRVLREGHAAQEIQRATGRPVCVQEAAVLLADLCEYANRPNEARIFMACAEALEEEMRGVWLRNGTTGASHRPGQDKQRTGEHSDAMQTLSRLLAYHGEAYWHDGRWENATPRVVNGVVKRVDRLKATGNGQVPRVAAAAWILLTEESS